jgi:hypothetical protein
VSVSTAIAFQQVTDGMFRLDFDRPDDLLLVRDIPDVHVLVLSAEHAETISDIHLQRLRDWIQGGGVLWVEGEGLDSGLVRALAPIKVHDFDFSKTTGENTGGELIVKGALPQHVIHDHPLTEGVKQLYLYPQRQFSGTPKLEPLVEMTPPGGNRGVILGAVPVGRGWIVLDGTARFMRHAWWPFGRKHGFDEDHPNAVRLGDRWNSYDWDRLLRAAVEVGEGGRAPN